ncbi:MAG: hypothetical protein ACPGE9_15460 [Algiphilus sp.]
MSAPLFQVAPAQPVVEGVAQRRAHRRRQHRRPQRQRVQRDQRAHAQQQQVAGHQEAHQQHRVDETGDRQQRDRPPRVQGDPVEQRLQPVHAGWGDRP